MVESPEGGFTWNLSPLLGATTCVLVTAFISSPSADLLLGNHKAGKGVAWIVKVLEFSYRKRNLPMF